MVAPCGVIWAMHVKAGTFEGVCKNSVPSWMRCGVVSWICSQSILKGGLQTLCVESVGVCPTAPKPGSVGMATNPTFGLQNRALWGWLQTPLLGSKTGVCGGWLQTPLLGSKTGVCGDGFKIHFWAPKPGCGDGKETGGHQPPQSLAFRV